MKIQLWREFLDPYDLAVKELITKFEHLKYEHKARGLYCPIEEVSGRVKSVSSILDKLKKKNLDMIAANNLKVAGAGFQGDTNQMTLITKEDETALPLISKEETAACILDKILECINK